MIRLIQRRLIIPRGDTGAFSIPTTAATSIGDVAIFTIFDCITRTKLFEKNVEIEGNSVTFNFSHNDTVNLKPGKYLWDIKFYKNPVFADGKLVNGEEIDSLYAGFSLPDCEIRETGDDLLISPNAPTATLSPVQLDIISSALIEVHEAVEKTETNVEHYPTIIENVWYLWDADLGEYASTGVHANCIPGGTTGQVYKKHSDADYDAEWGDETDPTVPAWAKAAQKPSYTAAEVGALPDDTFIPSNTSDLNNDSNFAVDANYVHTDNNYTTEEKNKLTGIAAGAEVNVNADWNAVSGDAQILNKPTNVSAFTNDAGYLTQHQDISGKADKTDTVLLTTLSRDRKTNTTVGTGSIAWGVTPEASGTYSTAVGGATTASGTYSTAIGQGTQASAVNAVAEGAYTVASGSNSHTEGMSTIANHRAQHALGEWNEADDSAANYDARGNYVVIVGNGAQDARSNAYTLDWSGNAWHAGKVSAGTVNSPATPTAANDLTTKSYVDTAISTLNTMVLHICTAEEYNAETGIPTVQTPDTNTLYLVPGGSSNNLYIEWAYVNNAWEKFGSADIDLSVYALKSDTILETTLSRGRKDNTTVGVASLAFGNLVTASGIYSQAVGSGATASGMAAHAEGLATTASGSAAHAEGWIADATGDYSHAEGRNTTASGEYSHAEGLNTTASYNHSHAEGNGTVASGLTSHAEGSGAQAQGAYSHAEGRNTIANGDGSHVSGFYNIADSYTSWPEWVASTSYEVGDKVKVTTTENNETTVKGYICKTANNDASFTTSKWTADSLMNYAEIVGNGTAFATRSNARALDWDGNEYLAGDLYVHANNDSSGGTKVAKVTDIPTNISTFTNDVGYLTTHQDISGKVDKSAIDDAGITAVSYTILKDETVTTATDATHTYPYAGSSGGSLSPKYKYRVTVDGNEYILRAYEFFHYNYVGTVLNSAKGFTYLGNPELYIDNITGICTPIYDVPFCLIYESVQLAGIQIYTDSAGEHTIKIERINLTKKDLPYSLIFGDEEAIIKKQTSNATSYYGVSVGENSIESARGAMAMGFCNTVSNEFSSAIGVNNQSSGWGSSARGGFSIASDRCSIADGYYVRATGEAAHAEGYDNEASGKYSHVEGTKCIASGQSSHAEGQNCTASANASHAEGLNTNATNYMAHAEGQTTTASGMCSHAEGNQTIANHKSQHVFGEYNIADVSSAASSARGDYLEIVGNGTAKTARSNAYTLDWSGNGRFNGDVYVGCNADSTGGTKVATVSQIPTVPVTDVQINGSSILSSGVANVPIADSETFGVVKASSARGVGMSNGLLTITPATVDMIKAGTDWYKPLGVRDLHASTFYGLAKAAGADMKNIANTTVGTYPDAQKAAIQHMLGTDTNLADYESDTTADQAYAIGELFMLNGKLHQATAAIAINDTFTVGTNCAVVNAADVFPHDVKVNGSSVVANGVANIPLASSSNFGAVKALGSTTGIQVDSGVLAIIGATSLAIKQGSSGTLAPITPSKQEEAVFYGLAKAAGDTTQSASSNAVGTYTSAAKAAIHSMLGTEDLVEVGFVEEVSGTTPTITGQANYRYICGEVATLSITPPSTGTIDVLFTSGSTATVLTLPNTVKLPSWFDYTNLDVNTTYELLISDGVYGSVMSWAT